MGPETRERWCYRLPHWEVAGRVHFVTVRCAGSLPSEAIGRVREIHEALQAIAPSSPQFATLQQSYFRTCERYLDAGHGRCPFREGSVCEMVLASLAEFPERKRWRVTDVTLMPNHVHLLLRPETGAEPLKRALRGWKWHVAKEANRLLGTSGMFWQADWFDRWARTETEIGRMRAYIRQNPMKAGLVGRWDEYLWTRSETSVATQRGQPDRASGKALAFNPARSS
jgi:REP element-mobilizing transposase RayT